MWRINVDALVERPREVLSYITKSTLNLAPTIDAVVVVRCKDCKSCRELNREDRNEEAYAEGVLWCTNQSDGVWPDDFCSYGVRKDEDKA